MADKGNRPLVEGSEVWSIEDESGPYEVKAITKDGSVIATLCFSGARYIRIFALSDVSLSNPNDSWTRLEDDARELIAVIADKLGDYDFDDSGMDSVQTRVMGLVRRARALAELEMG